MSLSVKNITFSIIILYTKEYILNALHCVVTFTGELSRFHLN